MINIDCVDAKMQVEFSIKCYLKINDMFGHQHMEKIWSPVRVIPTRGLRDFFGNTTYKKIFPDEYELYDFSR